ncbi:hypothetical protein IAT40_006364 [Kwoniella sp. CBS 6097]
MGESGLVQDKVLNYHMGDIEYFTPYHHPLYTLSAPLSASRWSPSFEPMVINSIPVPEEGIITQQHIKPLVESYLPQDDVLTSRWFKTVFLHLESQSQDGSPAQLPLEVSTVVYLMREMGMKRLVLDPTLYLTCHGPGGCLPAISLISLPLPLEKGVAGPYIVNARSDQSEEERYELFPVYRLYSDIYHTFLTGVYPLNDSSGIYMPLDKVNERGHKLIPVPSKLYALGSKAPLAGLRTPMKDIYDLKGLPTSAGSRAYGEWRGKANETATAVQILEKAGAVIVGKTKLAQFVADGQSVEASYDDRYPYSPRGDQGQSCGASSSGSACAMAAYDWLDFAVGSDTGGSIRGPAAILGLYGNRPSQGLLSLDNVTPLLGWSDTAGIFARTSSIFHKVLSAWYADSQANRRHNHLPGKILVPSDDFPTMRADIRDMVADFIQDTEKTFGMKTEMINMIEAHPPKEEKMSLRQFDDVLFADQWRKLGKPFVEGYERSHEGRFPPISSYMREWWHKAENQSWTPEMFDESKRLFDYTGEWFNGLIGRDEETCSKAIFMEPMALNELPAYREQKLTDTREPLSGRVNPLLADLPCSIAGCPHYVVPIGQVPFQSLVSEREEMQTVSMSLIAYPGCDFMLLDLINKLNYAGILQDVKTGLTAF